MGLSSNQIAYLQPANLNEMLTIQTRLLTAGDRSLLLEALMWDYDKKALKSVMWTRMVHYNIREQKSQAQSTKLMDFFSQIVWPLPAALSFEERVAQLRGSIKTAV